MQTATTIGLDIAKSVFQVHGVSAEGKAVIRRRRIHSALMWAARMTFFHL
jgi:transposase